MALDSSFLSAAYAIIPVTSAAGAGAPDTASPQNSGVTWTQLALSAALIRQVGPTLRRYRIMLTRYLAIRLIYLLYGEEYESLRTRRKRAMEKRGDEWRWWNNFWA